MSMLPRLRSFDETITRVYSSPDRQTRLIKSTFIGLCGDDERFFRLTYGIAISSPVDEDTFRRIKELFPNFDSADLVLFNRFLSTFACIRDVSAHLFLNKPIRIDSEMVAFLKRLFVPQYALDKQGEITIFGAMCVVFLFSSRYSLLTFTREAIRHDIFAEISKKDLVQQQQQFINTMKCLTGLSKPILPPSHSFVARADFTFFREQVKQTITKLLFDLEQHSVVNPMMSPKTVTTAALLKKYQCLASNDTLLSRVVELRNCWLHGYRLFDMAKTPRHEFLFDLPYLFELLKDLKQAFAFSKSIPIVDDIDECASYLIDFYTLRSIEVSFKLLDVALFDEAKTGERITNSLRAFAHIAQPDPWFYGETKALLKSDSKKWYLQAMKFSDKRPRTFQGDRLSVYLFSSSKGFEIGTNHFEATQIALTDIDCPTSSQLTINGKHLQEYKTHPDYSLGFIDVYQIQL